MKTLGQLLFDAEVKAGCERWGEWDEVPKLDKKYYEWIGKYFSEAVQLQLQIVSPVTVAWQSGYFSAMHDRMVIDVHKNEQRARDIVSGMPQAIVQALGVITALHPDEQLLLDIESAIVGVIDFTGDAIEVLKRCREKLYGI